METFLIITLLILLVVVLVLQIWQLRSKTVDLSPLLGKLEALQNLQERTDRSVRDEIAKFRAEMQTGAHQERAELADALMLYGQRALPGRLLAAGYVFRFPDLESALRHELGRIPYRHHGRANTKNN